MIQDILIFSFVFLIGTCIGSFLNVLIDRIPKGRSLVNSRSICDKCKKKLKYYDLIPLFSYLILFGKCRYCYSPIPSRILFVEIITGVLFVFIFLQPFVFPFSSILPVEMAFMYSAILVACLIVIFFTDLEYGIIPDQILITLILALMLMYLFTNPAHFLSHLLVGIGSFVFFLLIFILTRGRGMGFGDVKFSFLIGFFLGFPLTIVAFYSAFLTGAGISLILILLRKKKFRKDTVPFGPFLVAGIVVAVIFGDIILHALKLV